jgi:hypothetical protein
MYRNSQSPSSFRSRSPRSDSGVGAHGRSNPIEITSVRCGGNPEMRSRSARVFSETQIT